MKSTKTEGELIKIRNGKNRRTRRPLRSIECGPNESSINEPIPNRLAAMPGTTRHKGTHISGEKN